MRISDWSSDVCSSDLPEPEHGAAVVLGAQLLEIGQAADVPQPRDGLRIAAARRDLAVAREMLEHGKVDRLRRGAERRMGGGLAKVGDQPVERVEARLRVADRKSTGLNTSH